MYLSINGTTLYYEVIGNGPPLLMMHGNGEDSSIFFEASKILMNYFTVYLIDTRGHGKSSPVKDYHYQDMADDMKAFINALQLENVTFYGFSDGGIIGLLLASQTRLCRQYIVSGANARPSAVKTGVFLNVFLSWLTSGNSLQRLMFMEPHISNYELSKIKDPIVLLAGSNDLIREAHTKHLHRIIPGSKLEILLGEGHGDYIVHNEKIASLILKYTQNK